MTRAEFIKAYKSIQNDPAQVAKLIESHVTAESDIHVVDKVSIEVKDEDNIRLELTGSFTVYTRDDIRKYTTFAGYYAVAYINIYDILRGGEITINHKENDVDFGADSNDIKDISLFHIDDYIPDDAISDTVDNISKSYFIDAIKELAPMVILKLPKDPKFKVYQNIFNDIVKEFNIPADEIRISHIQEYLNKINIYKEYFSDYDNDDLYYHLRDIIIEFDDINDAAEDKLKELVKIFFEGFYDGDWDLGPYEFLTYSDKKMIDELCDIDESKISFSFI